jgi:putative oxidoreductase
MSFPPLVERPAKLALRVLLALAFLPPLLTRLVVGQTFYVAGGGKIANMERTVGFFTDLGIPFPELNAAFVARVEYYGGLLLIIGLLTRLAALMLSSTMVVALLTADRETFVSALTGSGEAGLTDIPAFVLLLLLSWLVVYGPGLVSLDHPLFRKLAAEAPREPPAS